MIGRRLRIETARPTEFVDITDRLQAEIDSSRLVNGRVHLQALHTTLGIALNENEPLLLSDFEAMLDRLAPRSAGYSHDDFSRRVGVPADEPANGHAHCRHLLLHPFQTVLVEDGRLLLGRWQSIFAVELDGPRDREIALQLEGEFAAADGSRELVELELRRQLMVDPEPVREPMRRLVEAGGKRLRPILVVLGSRLGPQPDQLRTAVLAAAVELLHSATLVHDDYVDESPRRRGRPTVAAKEGAERAIAVGDYYFAKATRLIAELGQPEVTSTIASAVEAICRSQIDDLTLRGGYPGDYGSYLKVVRGKTAALFSAAGVSGAQLSGAAPEVVECLRRYGELVGMAFQMADDMVDYSPASGKPLGQDIREKVVSLPLIFATEDERVGSEVRRLLAGSLSEADVERVQELVVASGSLERVGTEARGLVAAALRELEQVALDGVRTTLVELARAAVEREA
jgi:octaprenyl-diphosphate synthase